MFAIENVVKTLMEKDNIVILCHRSPDGDAIGSAYALHNALASFGKNVRIECADAFGSRFGFITEGIKFAEFEPEFVIAVDIADTKLLAAKQEQYPVIDLAIDHHGSHVPFAKMTYVESTAASACEIIFDIIMKMCGDVNKVQATALYTGVATDTGCFKFSNTTVRTHIIAAHLMGKGIDFAKINQKVFANSKAKALLEAKVLGKAQFFYGDNIAIQFVDDEIMKEVGACDDEVGALASSIQNIDGVMLGITIREAETNKFRLSVRSKSPVSAVNFCEKFGGGGHECAAGCTIEGNLADVYNYIVLEAINSCKDAGIIEEV